MRRLALTMLLMAAGCGQGPDDILSVRGSLLGAADEPVSGGTVQLQRHPHSAAPSLFEVCEGSEPLKSTTSQDDGSFSLALLRAEAQTLASGGPANATCITLRTAFDSGTRVASHVLDPFYDLQLPPMTDWQPNLQLRADGTVSYRPVMPFDAPNECQFSFEQYVGHRLTVWQGSDRFWETTDLVRGPDHAFTHQDATLPPEALEDVNGTMSIDGHRSGCGTSVGGEFPKGENRSVRANRVWESPERAPVNGSTVPISRGARCQGLGEPCPLTDGKAVPVVLEPSRRALHLTLSAPAAIRVVVFRSLSTNAATVRLVAGTQSDPIELGDHRWTPRPYVVASTMQGQPVFAKVGQFLRLELPKPLGVSDGIDLEFDAPVTALAEVSFFE
jgi:hypothetical protein